MRIKIKLKKNMLLGNQINNFLLSIFIFIFLLPNQIIAETISGNSVVLGGLDKITAKFTDFEINIGESKKFGTLSFQHHFHQECCKSMFLLTYSSHQISSEQHQV